MTIMVPKKPSEEISRYAEGKGIPVDDITDMINGYYRELKNKCSELEHPQLDIRGLGYIKASHRKVMTGIKKLETDIKDIPEEEKDSYYWKKYANLKKVKEMKVKIEAEWQREKDKKAIKDLYKQQHGLEGNA